MLSLQTGPFSYLKEARAEGNQELAPDSPVLNTVHTVAPSITSGDPEVDKKIKNLKKVRAFSTRVASPLGGGVRVSPTLVDSCPPPANWPVVRSSAPKSHFRATSSKINKTGPDFMPSLRSNIAISGTSKGHCGFGPKLHGLRPDLP